MEIGIFILVLGLSIMILAIAASGKQGSRGYRVTRERKHVPSSIDLIMDQGPQCAHAVGVYKAHKDRPSK